jgi:hypothetical protein
MYRSTLSLTSELEGGGWSTPRSGRFTRGKDPVPMYRRLGGPQGRSVRAQKITLLPGLEPQTIKPVASRYIVYAIPALILAVRSSKT